MKQDFENAQVLLELAKKVNILQLMSYDGELMVEFQYFKKHKGWPVRGYKVRKLGDDHWTERNTRFAPEHEILGYLSQFEFVGGY